MGKTQKEEKQLDVFPKVEVPKHIGGIIADEWHKMKKKHGDPTMNYKKFFILFFEQHSEQCGK